MAKCTYICSRQKLAASTAVKLREICKNLAPDNIQPAEPRIIVNGDIAYGIMNPTSTMLEKGNSLLLGQIADRIAEQWSVPLQEFPDGSYALFRDKGEYCEIVSDPAASRTIWYVKDENTFIASTSQRAIVMYLGSFEFDAKVVPWMLSTGTLGPDISWDRRIKRIPPDSSVILNKNTWEVTTKSNPIEFKPSERSDEDHEKSLLEALKTTFSTLDIDYLKWVLPLSGGYDSRGILCLLLDNIPNAISLRTVTWGLKSSLEVKGNDAYVAKELANRLKVSNVYYCNDISEEPIDTIIDRFVMVGEGRTDNIADYMDGFKTWKNLFEDGVEGIIRGDEGFGCHQYWSALVVKLNQSCFVCSDISNLKNYRKYGFPLQEIPQHLKHRKGETLSTWRDRLFHEYTLPTLFSALTDLKLSYTEQINPLLYRRILQQVRQLPDHLRTEKFLFKKIVNTISPDIEYATRVSSASLSEIFREKQMAGLLKNELSSDTARSLFSANFLEFISRGIKSKDKITTPKTESFSLISSFKKYLPRFLKNAIQEKVLPSIDSNILAFRVLLICRMYRTLNEDKISLYR
jgi:hypothetical protein